MKKIKFKCFEEFQNIHEVLPEYKDWADIKQPIDSDKNPLSVGDKVQLDDLSTLPKLANKHNEWVILAFDTGTSAGVEANIQNIYHVANNRSEAVRYVTKLK